jgi:hypothetical protein
VRHALLDLTWPIKDPAMRLKISFPGSNKSLELKFALNRNGPNWCQNLELEFGKKFLTKKY